MIHHLPDEVTTMNKAARRQSDEEEVSHWKLAVSEESPSSSPKSQGPVGADNYTQHGKIREKRDTFPAV